ncbi:MAG TPA: 23S rRNA (uracil(1939)-C(5))-methyltransferase RlmD [Geminicoccaceae bacterium]|nr:23S rRNA (uracil(1939)-C(5))-methyltransferase RlmD [Geminicoccaceae bacterium]
MTAAAGEPYEVVIEAIGARGDGIARRGATRVFVPLALPGDRLRVRIAGRRGDGLVGEPVERLEQAPRAKPPCPHFGACGGCQLQHLPAAQYRAWKQGQVVTALARQGLRGIPVAPLASTPPGGRRRARLAFVREGGAIRLGFRERTGHRVVAVRTCPVLAPELVALLPPLGDLLAGLDLARGGGEVEITASATGIDLLIVAPPVPGLRDRETLARFAHAHDLARISWAPAAKAEAEPIAQRRVPSVAFDQVQVALPAGAFLQASSAAELLILRAIGEAIGRARDIADLFAGCGTFGLPLAAGGGTVHAVEAEPAMLEALRRAARSAGLAARVTTEVRDLQAAPLAGAELERFDAVVVDPPHSGARAQAAALAASGPGRLAMVSCNPATFARDARSLVEGGYECLWVQPVDAFLWSSRIELVAAFAREAGARSEPCRSRPGG